MERKEDKIKKGNKHGRNERRGKEENQGPVSVVMMS